MKYISLKTKTILALISVLIFFQNAFVFRLAGGSVKWYELLGCLTSLYLLIAYEKITFDKNLIYLSIIFIISPLISNFLLFGYPEVKDIYNRRFPEAVNSLRCNPYFSTIYSLILSFGCFSIIYFIIKSEYVKNNYEKLVRYFIITGSVIAVYSIYEVVGIFFLGLPDIVPSFLESRNFTARNGARAGGFSIEPGTYVVIQTFVVLYLYFDNNYFSKRINFLLKIINTIALLLTFSSSILIPLATVFIGCMFFSKNKKMKIVLLIVILLIVLMIPILNQMTNGMLEYVFVKKIQNFIHGAEHTLDSGSMRSYTNKLGINIFLDNLIFGCGFGNSFFFMPKYEYSVRILVWGERILPTLCPQNNISKILAEQGLLGTIPFCIFFIRFLLITFKLRYDKHIVTINLITLSVFLFSLVAGIYITNLFIWFNIALGINYVNKLRIRGINEK